MADIEERAEAEAAHKGLTGGARRAYVGGVWNRIRQAHARATQPGEHAVPKKLFNRRQRQLARERYRNAIRPHAEAISGLKRMRDFALGRHQDEPAAQGTIKPATMERAERDRAYDARQDERLGLTPGTHELIRRNGFYVTEPQIEGAPWTIWRDDGKTFYGANSGGAGDEANGGVRAESSPAGIEAFIRQVNERPRIFVPPSDAAQDALLRHQATHGSIDMPATPREVGQQLAELRAGKSGLPAEQQAQAINALEWEQRAQAVAPTPTPAKPTRERLMPIKPLPNLPFDATRKLDPYFIKEYYGDGQLSEALNRQTPDNLREAVEVVQAKHPGTKPAGRGRAAMIAYIEGHVKG